MASDAGAIRIREIAHELRILPEVLGDCYGHRKVLWHGADLVVEAFKAGAFRGDSRFAPLGLRIRHYIDMPNDPLNVAVQEGCEPDWRTHVWYATILQLDPVFYQSNSDEAVCLAVSLVADTLEDEADRLDAADGNAQPDQDDDIPDNESTASLTPEDREILNALAKLGTTVTQEHLCSMIQLSERSLGKRLKFLRASGLVDRPFGPRKGDAITDRGRTVLSRAD